MLLSAVAVVAAKAAFGSDDDEALRLGKGAEGRRLLLGETALGDDKAGLELEDDDVLVGELKLEL